MIKIMLIKNELSKDEKDFFEKMNPGFSVTGTYYVWNQMMVVAKNM